MSDLDTVESPEISRAVESPHLLGPVNKGAEVWGETVPALIYHLPIW